MGSKAVVRPAGVPFALRLVDLGAGWSTKEGGAMPHRRGRHAALPLSGPPPSERLRRLEECTPAARSPIPSTARSGYASSPTCSPGARPGRLRAVVSRTA